MKTIVTTLTLSLLVSSIFGLAACAPLTKKPIEPAPGVDLMMGIQGNNVNGKDTDTNFIESSTEFSFTLFKTARDQNKNSLVSPLSVLLALAMTANGADGATLTEIEEVLAKGISIPELNEYLYSYIQGLPQHEKTKLSLANSIWFRDDQDRLKVEKNFLQKNADYYQAEIYSSSFDNQTIEQINSWVKNKTTGLIEKIIEEIPEDTVMYLLNAIVFDAEWERIYRQEEIRPDQFTSASGKKQVIEFMHSEESTFLKDSRGTGFVKPYADGHYSFIALLPKEGLDIDSYIDSLSGKEFVRILETARNTPVNVALPKFSYDCEIELNDALEEMGMPLAFSAAQANLSKLGQSSRGNLYIGEVLHKTFIKVDERGTKAGAVTKVDIKVEAYMETESVILNRPFVYAIIDTATNLPIFIGTVLDIPVD